MFLKLHQYSNSPNYDKLPVWVNFNTIHTMRSSTFNANKVEVTVTELSNLVFDREGNEQRHLVHESPEVICELLKENKSVKLLFGGK